MCECERKNFFWCHSYWVYFLYKQLSESSVPESSSHMDGVPPRPPSGQPARPGSAQSQYQQVRYSTVTLKVCSHVTKFNSSSPPILYWSTQHLGENASTTHELFEYGRVIRYLWTDCQFEIPFWTWGFCCKTAPKCREDAKTNLYRCHADSSSQRKLLVLCTTWTILENNEQTKKN